MTPIAGDVKTITAKKSSSRKHTAVKVEQAEVCSNVLFVFLPPYKYVALNLDFGKPKSFESAAKRIEWEENASRYAIELKRKLELGEVRAKDVKKRLIFNLPLNKISFEAVNRFKIQMTKQEESLHIEREFWQASEQCRISLGFARADVNCCIQMLNKLKDLELSRTILLRGHDSVDIIRRLRRYIGNLPHWNLNEQEEEEFKQKAEVIRNTAIIVYDNFKKIFKFSGSDFTSYYLDKHEEFKQLTEHITLRKRMIISDSMYESMVAKQKNVAKNKEISMNATKTDNPQLQRRQIKLKPSRLNAFGNAEKSQD